MNHRLLNIFTLLIVLFGYLFYGNSQPLQVLALSGSPPKNPFEIRVLQTRTDGLTLSLETPSYSLEPVLLSSNAYVQLTFPGGELGGNPGQPQLPSVSELIGIPVDAEISVQITTSDDVRNILPSFLEGQYTLPPGPHPLPLENDLDSGEMGYEPDQTTYALDQWLPANPVQLGEQAWLRDQRVMRVTFYPFQYNPAQRALRWSPYLQADINFTGGQAPQPFTLSPFENLFKQTLLNYPQARSWRISNAQFPISGLPVSISNFQSLGPRFDITVNQDGIYRVTYDDLQAAGMDVDNVDPTTFHLHNQGEDVAIYVFGEGDGSFDPGDYLSLYGEKFRGDTLAERYQAMMDPGNGQPGNNWFWLCAPGDCDLAGALEQYTDENIYSLVFGGTPGPRMTTVDGTPAGGTIPTVYTTTVRAEVSNYWWAFEFESEDVWFWSQIQRTTASLPYTTTYPINLTAVAPGYPATLHAEVASRNATSGFPDHHTQFRLNAGSSLLDDVYWDGISRHAFTAQVTASDIVDGENNLLFTMLPDVAPGSTRMYFDYFEVTYFRFFTASSNQLAFTRYAPGNWKYQVDGFTSPSVEVYNITDRLNPIRVLNPGMTGTNPYTTLFNTTDGNTASYFVSGTESILTPLRITSYQPPDFASMPEADYLFISHEDFIPSLQPLVAYRESQGLSVAIVDVDDLYREFNDGIYHPIAIKNFLAYTFANWNTPPVYVTLVGSGHWNFKHYGAPTEPYANPPPIYMPPNLAYIDPWQGQTDAANLLATLVGDDPLPDLHISRLPISTPAELDVIVGKTLAYETQPVQDWQRNITFIADNIPDPAGDFVALAEDIIGDFIDADPYYQPIRIYENDYGCITSNSPECNAVTYAITSTINITGSLLVNYIGHGSLNRWSGESIFLNADVHTLNNPDQLPIILSWTCLDGYWLYPNMDSLARTFLVTSGKGAVATFSPTGLGVATGHDALQRGFFEALFDQGRWNLGEAALQGKIKLFATNNNFDLLHTFTLYGDPALQMTTPYDVALNPETVAQSAPAGDTVTYTLEISNPGLVTDTYTVTFSGNSWDVSLSDTIIGPVAPEASATFTLTVDIPANALGNQTDPLTILATSQESLSETDSSSISTTALTNGLELTPFVQSSVGPPGTYLTYTLSLTNTSVTTDVFSLSLSENSWVSSLSTPSISVAPGARQNFQLVVQIPLEALGNDQDQAIILAQSTNEPTHAAVASAISTAITNGFALSPEQQSQIGLAGSTVTYVLHINNLLNSSEYYVVTFAGQQWETYAPITVGPANPGESVNFLVTVTVPISATTGLSDTVTVTVAMLDTPNELATSTLTTVAEELPPPPPDVFTIFLPVIIRP